MAKFDLFLFFIFLLKSKKKIIFSIFENYQNLISGWPLRICIEIQGFQGFFKVFLSQIQGF